MKFAQAPHVEDDSESTSLEAHGTRSEDQTTERGSLNRVESHKRAQHGHVQFYAGVDKASSSEEIIVNARVTIKTEFRVTKDLWGAKEAEKNLKAMIRKRVMLFLEENMYGGRDLVDRADLVNWDWKRDKTTSKSQMPDTK
ncbi:hypothetical protein SLS60_005842 [Paraconiothyrium brasiliense]|uniref:Uncharacterized protein n=1 Tax=Paraconiothyrium brasiliense TaxID=300254 RepID=A0ABR3RD99_9PLEO